MNDVVKRLAAIDSRFHWMLANSGLVASEFSGILPIYGKRGIWLLRLFQFLGCGKLSLLALRLIGMLSGYSWWKRAGGNSCLPATPFRLFVGFGAGIEEELWTRYRHESPIPAVHLDQTSPVTFGRLLRPGLAAMCKQVWRQSSAALDMVRASGDPHIRKNKAEILQFVAVRMGEYAFFRAWWQGAPLQAIRDVVFISADTASFACIDAGCPCAGYWQHGLLRRSMLMPAFQRLHLLFDEELAYFREMLPGSSMLKQQRDQGGVGDRRAAIVIASIYDDTEFSRADSLGMLKDVVRWAGEKSLEIIVRPHPREDSGFWLENFPGIKIDDSGQSFDTLLMGCRPMYVFSWFSTSLLDALRLGCVPVTMSEGSCMHVSDLIVPLLRKCMKWPGDVMKLDGALSDAMAYGRMLHQLDSPLGND